MKKCLIVTDEGIIKAGLLENVLIFIKDSFVDEDVNAGFELFIYGLNLSISKGDIIRSAIEGITFEIRENIETTETMVGKIKNIVLFGGGSKNREWQRIIANVLGKDIIVSETPETAVYGAGILAGINLGIYNSIPSGKNRLIKYNQLLSREYNKLKMNHGYTTFVMNIYRPLIDTSGARYYRLTAHQAKECLRNKWGTISVF